MNQEVCLQTNPYQLVHGNRFIFKSHHHILEAGIGCHFFFFRATNDSHVVGTQNQVLRGCYYGLAILGVQNVVGSQHKKSRLCLGLRTQWYVDCHLVTVKVRVVGSTHKRMQFQGSAFHQHRLEGLNAQSVQCWSTVQKNRMILDYFFQHIPDFGSTGFHHPFRIFNILCVVFLHQLFHNKGFKEFQCHFFR